MWTSWTRKFSWNFHAYYKLDVVSQKTEKVKRNTFGHDPNRNFIDPCIGKSGGSLFPYIENKWAPTRTPNCQQSAFRCFRLRCNVRLYIPSIICLFYLREMPTYFLYTRTYNQGTGNGGLEFWKRISGRARISTKDFTLISVKYVCICFCFMRNRYRQKLYIVHKNNLHGISWI